MHNTRADVALRRGRLPFSPFLAPRRCGRRPEGRFFAPCAASLMELAASVNAEAAARREGKELIGKKTGGVQEMQSVPASLLSRKPALCASVLRKMGCLGISEVLSEATAERVLAFVKDENARAQAEVTRGDVPFDARFGGVNCRGMLGTFGQRQDLFMPMSSPVLREAVAEVVRNMKPMLDDLVGEEAMLHEISSLVAERGAPRQCLHADTIVLPCPQYPGVHMEPLYTFFVALQDVEDDMGHTQFLPYTHTHELWNAAGRNDGLKDRFISAQAAVHSRLRRGDAAAFDSRLLHCGCANSSDTLRVLMYVTISRALRWPLPDGLHGSNSVREEDRWRWQLPSLLADP